VTVLLAFVAAVLFSTGTYLLLQRRLSRIIVGIGLPWTATLDLQAKQEA
jgi:multicomponent Na+:H+ antiporter subunit C